MSLPLAFRAILVSCLLALTAQAQQPDVAEAAKANNAFAFDLYQGLRAREGNIFFSPYSISSALAMTWAGARGNTETEMAKALHIGLPQERFHEAAGALLKELNSRVLEGEYEGDADKGRKAFELVVANALWTQKGYPFRKEYQEKVTKTYGAGLTELDFLTDVESARKTINDWVEDKTNKRIQDVIPAGGLSPDARLVLTNAIYFRANWESRFYDDSTKDEDFHAAGSMTVKVPMMHRTGNYSYFSEGSFEAIELPYEEEMASMVVLVPKEADGLAALEAKLKARDVETWIGKMAPVTVILGLPRFKTTSSFDLSRELGALGMKDAFKSAGADFSGMSETKELFVGSVNHKAFVEVNEEGTVAAAISLTVTFGTTKEKEPIRLQVDRPFVFLIRDVKTGTILFMGRVLDPRS